MYRNLKVPFSLGLFSGFLSFLFSYLFGPFLLHYVIPGFIFGICTAYYLKRNASAGTLVLWIPASLGSYFAAAMYTLWRLPYYSNPSFSSVLIGGLIGSMLLILSYHLLIQRLSILHGASLILLGTILGVSFFVPKFFGINSDELMNYLLLLIVWQTGMMIGISLCLPKKNLKNR